MTRLARAVPLALLLLLAIPASAQSHQVVLSWTASTSTVTGYNVYRLAGACPASVSMPAFTKLTTTPVTGLTYTDATVTAGATYCYVVTAVAPGGESTPNGTLQVSIPIFTASSVPNAPGATSSSVQ